MKCTLLEKYYHNDVNHEIPGSDGNHNLATIEETIAVHLCALFHSRS